MVLSIEKSRCLEDDDKGIKKGVMHECLDYKVKGITPSRGIYGPKRVLLVTFIDHD